MAPIVAANDSSIADDGKPNRAREVDAFREQEQHEELSARDKPATIGLRTTSPRAEDRRAEPDLSRTPLGQNTQDAKRTLQETNNSKETKLTRRYTSSVTSSKTINVTPGVPFRSREPDASEPEIFGPRPISASLADSSTLSNYFWQSDLKHNRHHCKDEHSESQRLPRKSVADNLSFLVERERLESTNTDVIGDRPVLPHGTSAIAYSDGGKPYEETSFTGHEPKLSKVHSPQSLHSPGTETESPCRESPKNRSPYSDRSDIGLPLHSCRSEQRKLSKTRKQRDSNNSSIQRSSSDVEVRTAKSPEFSSVGSRRAWSLGNSHGLSGSNTEGIELHSFGGNEAADDHDCGKERNAVAPPSLQELLGSRSSDEGSILEHKRHRKPSASASLGPKSRRSSSGRSKSYRSVSRSTSWFRKSWFNPFGGDERSVVEDLSPEAPISTSASRTTDGAQQGFFPFPEQSAQDGVTNHSAAGHDYQGKSTASTNSAKRTLQKPNSKKEKAVPEYRVDESDRAKEARQSRGHSWSPQEVTPTFGLPAVDHQTVAELPEVSSPKYAKSSSGSSHVSAKSRSIAVPVRQSSKKAPTSPSKAASLISAKSHGSLPLEGNMLDEASASHLPSQKSSSSNSIELHRSSRDSPVASRSSNTGRAPRPEAGSPQQQPQVDYGQRGSKGRGRGITSIQVIISFDGADDLVIEAGAGVAGGHWGLGG